MKTLEISGCQDCPFYSRKYCNLGVWFNNVNNFVVNEMQAGVIPNECPLRNGGVSFVLKKKTNKNENSDLV